MSERRSVAAAPAFTITSPSTTVKLDANRKAQVAFTATNASSQPLKGHARIVPHEHAKAEWFTIDGDVERPFAAGGTQQFTVRIAVPATAAPGKYTFQLKIAAVQNPDELYGEGQQIAFEVQKPAPKPQPLPWIWIAAAVVAVLVLAGGGFALFKVLNPDKPLASLDNTALTFASQDTGTTSGAQTVTLTNRGNADLTVKKASLSGVAGTEFVLVKDGCSNTTLKPGKGCSLDVAFEPRTVGPRDAILTVPSSSTQSLTVTLTGTATGQPQGSLDRPSLTFGNQDVATTSPPQSVTLSSVGNADLALQQVVLSGPANGEFSVAKDSCSKTTVKPGGNCSITVTFIPTNVGTRTATLTFTNTPEQPLTVSLAGTGTVSRPGLYAGTWVPDQALAAGITSLTINESSGLLTITASGRCWNGLTTTACSFGSAFVRFTTEPVNVLTSSGYSLQLALDSAGGSLTVIARNVPGMPTSALAYHRFRLIVISPPILQLLHP